MKRRAVTLAALTFGLIAMSGPASAAASKPRFRFVGTAAPAARAHTDTRYAAYSLANGDVNVIDTRAGGSRVIVPPTACPLRDLGGGYLLWSCDGQGYQTDGFVLNLGTSEVREVQTPRDDGPGTFTRAGGNWLELVGRDHRGGYGTYLASIVSGGYYYPPAGDDAGHAIDLDTASPFKRLCAPLYRDRNPNYDGDLDKDFFLPYAYERPWGLHANPHGLFLSRCGRHGSRRLTRRASAGGQLLAGVVTFSKGSNVVAYAPRTGRRFRWSASEIDPAGGALAISHTRNRLFVTVHEAGATARVYSAPFQG